MRTRCRRKKVFYQNNIRLRFLESNEITYKQFNNEFIPNLSIIDILMFNSKDEIRNMLIQFEML